MVLQVQWTFTVNKLKLYISHYNVRINLNTTHDSATYVQTCSPFSAPTEEDSNIMNKNSKCCLKL